MNIFLNGKSQPISSQTSLAQLIAPMALTGRRFAVERNGEVVPKSQFETVFLADQDKIEIVVAVGGG